ncbi:hypothetical protein CRG98_026436 [Punica granatum]|uniref:Uncharacterized protein n=1 Tax=Punica granatum TaxID=22663 RepID=A0A2I0JA83_PUNGR|nr:hypothetical protein CRG98_026436 [Punica granatum]
MKVQLTAGEGREQKQQQLSSSLRLEQGQIDFNWERGELAAARTETVKYEPGMAGLYSSEMENETTERNDYVDWIMGLLSSVQAELGLLFFFG